MTSAAPPSPSGIRSNLVSGRAAWQRLPREARDTLFQLAVIAWTILPHLSHLPFWCAGLAGLMLIWRASLSLANKPLPGRAPLLAVMLIAAALTLWTEHSLLGKEAGVSMLVVLLSLKTLEMRGRRDALVVFFLGFFLVLTHCLYSQSLFTALSMAISTWGLLTAQVLSSMPVGKPRLRHAAILAARSALLGLPLMAALFVLFPRIGPLWGLPHDAMGRTGLSSTLRLGGLSEVANDDSIAFRVRFDGAGPPGSALYFRGPVLSRFDGLEWSSAPPQMLSQSLSQSLSQTEARSLLRVQGQPLAYEMILEPIRLPLLPLLEATPAGIESAPQLSGWRLRQDAEMRWLTDRLVTERVRIQAQAWVQHRHGPLVFQSGLLALAQLPLGSNPRAIAWARQLRAEPRLAQASAQDLAEELMAHIRKHNFSYTMQPGSYGSHAIDEFWLDRQQGFCEHYASGFVLLMRAMGVPARIVTGYQGAEPPDAEGWRVVRQSHAHAWAEYWQAGIGWRRADPTAAVAPERVSNGRQLAPRRGLVASAMNTLSPEFADRLKRAWESMDHSWNQWVMSYSRTRQFDLLQTLGLESPSWQDLVWLLLAVTSALALGAAGWAWLDQRRMDPWVRQHGRIRAGLLTLGIHSSPQHGPRSLADLARQHCGPAAHSLAATLDELDLLRYGPAGQSLPTAGWRRRFQRGLRDCRRQLAATPSVTSAVAVDAAARAR